MGPVRLAATLRIILPGDGDGDEQHEQHEQLYSAGEAACLADAASGGSCVLLASPATSVGGGGGGAAGTGAGGDEEGALVGGAAYVARIADTVAGRPLPVSDCRVAEQFLFIDEAGRIAPCSFTAVLSSADVAPGTFSIT